MSVRDPYAEVYDVLYGGQGEELASLAAFLSRHFPPGSRILDAGCGTGLYMLALREAGEAYQVAGLDLSVGMLDRAQARFGTSGYEPLLVRGDLAALPLARGFDGIICLDSPLALLPTDEALAAAMEGFRRVLLPGGRLVVDVYDYPGAVEPGAPGQPADFHTSWCRVRVDETHEYDRDAGIWRMGQDFTVRRGQSVERFRVEHLLRIRTVDEYARYLEGAGFRILELLADRPGGPPVYSGGPRMIFVAA